MRRAYQFDVDVEARVFCDEIIEAMQRMFGIAEDEALGRLNKMWNRNGFQGDDIRYHEEAEFWASDIYYGGSSYWWMNPPGLKPLPYP